MARIIPLEPGADPTSLPTRSTGGGLFGGLGGGDHTWLWGLGLLGMVLVYFFLLKPAGAKARAQLNPPTATPAITSTSAMADVPSQAPTAAATSSPTPTLTPEGYWNMFPDRTTTATPATRGIPGLPAVTIPPVVINKEITRIVPVEVTRVVQLPGQTDVKVVVVTLPPVQQTVIVTATPLPSPTMAPTQTPWIVYQTVEVIHTVEVTPTFTVTPSLTPTVTGEAPLVVNTDPTATVTQP